MARPGDNEGFVQETADAAVGHIERAFRHADLEVAGRRLTAQYTATWPSPRMIFDTPIAGVFRAGGANSRPFAYAWFAAQFERGVTGERPLLADNTEGDTGDIEMAEEFFHGNLNVDVYNVEYVDSVLRPPTRLGLELWRIGHGARNAYRAYANGPVIFNIPYDLLDALVREVRFRLNWPRVRPVVDDPPPPFEWPEDTF